MEHGKDRHRDSTRREPIDPDLRRIQQMNEEVDFVDTFDGMVRGFEKSLRDAVSTVISKISSVFSSEEPQSAQEKSGKILQLPPHPQNPQRPARKPSGRKAA